jgi:hypothetical protein
MDETFTAYTVTLSVPCAGSQALDPDAFAEAASRAAWRRSASVVSTRAAGRIIAAVTVQAPGRYAATAVARAVVSDALGESAATTRRTPGRIAA